MTTFNLTVEGKAIAQVPADQASLKVEISATAKTQDAAKECLKTKTNEFEGDFLPRPGLVAPKKMAKTKKGTKDGSATSGFVVVAEDLDEDAPSEHPFVPRAPAMLRTHDLFGFPASTDAMLDAYLGAPVNDFDAVCGFSTSPSAAGVESWKKGEVFVVNTSRYKTTPAQRKAKKLKKPDNQLYTTPAYMPEPPLPRIPPVGLPMDPLAALSLNDEDWLQEYTAKVSYTIDYFDATLIPAALQSLNCKVSTPSLRLRPETKAQTRASLRERAAADALSQVKDYCNGLSCNATTTRIAPIDFGTVASIRREHRMSRMRSRSPPSRRRRNYSYSPSRSGSDYSSDEDDSSDFEERNGRGQKKNMVELEHRVEVTFKIETDEMTLKDINSK